ncbi:MAG: HAD-IA family hydrolase [Pseudomonadota bacterium]
MARHKLVIFDCDGTLVDSQDLIVQAMDQAFLEAQLTPPPRQHTLSIVGLSLLEAMQVLIPDAAEADQHHLAGLYKTSFGRLVANTDRKEPLYAGAGETVRILSNRADVVLGIATGKSQRGVRRVLAEHDLQACFVTLQTADDAPSKPHPAMIHQAMAEAGAEPEDTLMIGDTVYDLQMAQAAGVAAIGVDWGYHSAEDLHSCSPDALLSSFSELHGALEVIWRAEASSQGEIA